MRYPYPHHSSTYRSSVDRGSNPDNVKYFEDKAAEADAELKANLIAIAVVGLAIIATTFVCYKVFNRKPK